MTDQAAAAPAAPASAGRRARSRKGEGRRLREEILDATEALLLETGAAEQVSIRAVADAVGVTPPSIYRHFPDKDTLIYEVWDRRCGTLDDAFERGRWPASTTRSTALMGHRPGVRATSGSRTPSPTGSCS